ncbi:MAG: hypothetical protein AAFQ42_12025 [Pseudomonadota bacterium]
MLSFFGRTSQVISVIFLSFVLGAILAGLTAFYNAEWFDQIINFASDVKAYLTNDWLPLEVNVWFKFLLKDEALVLMFFTMIARVLLYALFFVFNMVMAMFREPMPSRYEVRTLREQNAAMEEEIRQLRKANTVDPGLKPIG